MGIAEKRDTSRRTRDRWYKAGKDLLGEIAAAKPGKGEAYAWFVGQHGFVVCLGGLVFYIDVILDDLSDGNGESLRTYPPPFAPDEIQRVDYVLCTHDHIDHLSLDTLLPLAGANPGARFVVPAPLKRSLCDAGIPEGRVLAANAGESLTLPAPAGDAVTLFPVPAVHARHIREDGDGERDENGNLVSLGFVLKGGGVSAYHSGDTWVTPPLLDALRAHAPVDIAMLPINGTDWERTAANCVGNMGPLDAAKLARAVPFDLVIPSHYDMIAHNGENPARFAEAMYALCPEKRFHVCALGERLVYRKGD